MAVVMTTKFYEEDTPDWHDLSKIVFTSPNMDSPNTAGTRSHILPGQLDLGMWYEDVPNMYIIEDKQEVDSSTYFGYSAQVYDQFDMGSPPLYITIGQTDQTDWMEYVRERVDISGNSWPMKYNLISGNYGYRSFIGCTVSGSIKKDIDETIFIMEFDVYAPDGSVTLQTSPFYITHLEYGCASAMVADIETFSGDGNYIFSCHRDSFNEYESKQFELPYEHSIVSYSTFYIRLSALYDPGPPSTFIGSSMFDFGLIGYYGSADYTADLITCNSGTNPENIFNPIGWHVDVSEAEPYWVTIRFPSPERVTKIEFNNYEGYEIKDYKVQACTTASGTYVDLYNGSALFDYEAAQTITFSNYIGYNYYRFYVYSKHASSAGYGITRCKMYEYDVDESITNPITLYIDNETTVDVSHINNAESTDYLFKLDIDSVNGTGVVVSGTNIYGWGQAGLSDIQVLNTNSIVFEVTIGECYDCRLTAWDDTTHSTTLNHLIASDRCRVSCLVYNAKGTSIAPTENEGVSFIHPPVLNKIFKGNTVYEGEALYYGDFNMIYRTGSVLGDYLIFKPMLYDIDETIPYGVHDHVIVLHYSYT